jgi:hypothetical protein
MRKAFGWRRSRISMLELEAEVIGRHHMGSFMPHETNLNEDGVPRFEAACTGTTNLSSYANSVCVCVCVYANGHEGRWKGVLNTIANCYCCSVAINIDSHLPIIRPPTCAETAPSPSHPSPLQRLSAQPERAAYGPGCVHTVRDSGVCTGRDACPLSFRVWNMRFSSPRQISRYSEAETSPVRFLMRSLHFLFDLTLPFARALWSIHCLTEMSIRNLPGGKGCSPAREADLTAICKHTV